jgi:4-phospho-D-threonate 3-dehydrogenase / 4-phospho-D-erythronate 3-dehydrogenase
VKPVIGITIGDPAGIGPEIVLKALADARVHSALQPVIFGDQTVLEQAMAQTGLALPISCISKSSEIDPAGVALPLLDAGLIRQPVHMGRIDGTCGQAAFAYISKAIEWALAGSVAALATAPINKASLQQGGVPYIDHTGMLAGLTASHKPMTLFVVGQLRIFFLTKHIPLRRVADALSIAGVVDGLVQSDKGLRQLGLAKRRIALAALNPHASDEGLFGEEEALILAPAVAQARALGLDVSGPVPADAVFHQCAQGEFDAVLSLYHDQGHIAAKTLDFHGTVSLTLGLPFLRTTPDHGTAFAIAGKNQANPTSMVEALLAAARHG